MGEQRAGPPLPPMGEQSSGRGSAGLAGALHPHVNLLFRSMEKESMW